jgi:hypothetical protein
VPPDGWPTFCKLSAFAKKGSTWDGAGEHLGLTRNTARKLLAGVRERYVFNPLRCEGWATCLRLTKDRPQVDPPVPQDRYAIGESKEMIEKNRCTTSIVELPRHLAMLMGVKNWVKRATNIRHVFYNLYGNTAELAYILWTRPGLWDKPLAEITFLFTRSQFATYF